MNTEILVALIALIGTLVGSFGGILASSRLTTYKISQLEIKVEKHNSLIERTYKLEEEYAVMDNRVKVNEHRIEDLERSETSK